MGSKAFPSPGSPDSLVPDAVRAEMTTSILWMAALERWMASPNTGCPLFCVPGGSGRRDDCSGSKMAAREDKKPAGPAGQPLGKLQKAFGKLDGRPDSEKRRRDGKKRRREAPNGTGEPNVRAGAIREGRSPPPGRQRFAPSRSWRWRRPVVASGLAFRQPRSGASTP